MKIMQTKSHRFIAVRLETTGSEERKLRPREMQADQSGQGIRRREEEAHLFVVVQKLSIVVTPIMTLAGTAFTSNQKEMKELVTSTIPGTKTVLK